MKKTAETFVTLLSIIIFVISIITTIGLVEVYEDISTTILLLYVIYYITTIMFLITPIIIIKMLLEKFYSTDELEENTQEEIDTYNESFALNQFSKKLYYQDTKNLEYILKHKQDFQEDYIKAVIHELDRRGSIDNTIQDTLLSLK